ncbi:hypothetical protein [Sediminispirochaeta bajacaliforniensis]|uniref:hypothetical protein n=1 Tax=Sediminispirochaeta bajacaliforniensis TaxID=148 RepID=UPI000374A723|nr:hypothetical protein [Sediminispirochaeta bajacaliforniensis]
MDKEKAMKNLGKMGERHAQNMDTFADKYVDIQLGKAVKHLAEQGTEVTTESIVQYLKEEIERRSLIPGEDVYAESARRAIALLNRQ